MATFNLNSFVNNLHHKFEPGLRKHLQNVYGCLAISMLSAAVGSYIHVFTNYLQGNFLSSLVGLGFLLALIATPDNGKNRSMRLGFLVGLAFTMGLSLGPLLDAVIRINPSIIVTAFLGTCLIFACFSISALLSDSRKWLYLGGVLMSAMSMLVLLSIANFFIGSKLFFQINMYGGLAVFCVFILYDTQMIIEKYNQGNKDFIWHSVDIFIDFMNVFRFLLVILTDKERSKKRRD